MPTKELGFTNNNTVLYCLISWDKAGELSINWFNLLTGYTNSQNVYLAAHGMDATPDLEALLIALDDNNTWDRLCKLIAWDDEIDQDFELVDDQFRSA